MNFLAQLLKKKIFSKELSHIVDPKELVGIKNPFDSMQVYVQGRP